MQKTVPSDGSLLTPSALRQRWQIRREARARMMAYRSQIVARLLSKGDLARYRRHLSTLQADPVALAIAYHERVAAALRDDMTLAEAAAQVVLRADSAENFDDGFDAASDASAVARPHRSVVQVIAANTPVPVGVEKRAAERAEMLRRLIKP